jgi:hypothetical protein
MDVKMTQLKKRSKQDEEERKYDLNINLEPHFEPIKQRIRAECPNVEISLLANPRDDAGGVLYVRNVPKELVRRIRVSVDYVMVPLDDRSATDILIVPIPEPDLVMRPRVSTVIQV